MKIDNSLNSSAAVAVLADEPVQTARKPSAGSAPAPADSVQLSSLSTRLRAAEKGLVNTPIIDAARVAEVKQAIVNGHFKVDAGKVSDLVLQMVQGLILAQKA
jgi:negative regulator of flagellin synthesis FlgM